MELGFWISTVEIESREPLVFFLKSYAPDLEFAHRFLQSFTRHNVDGIPLLLVVPDSEIGLFETFTNAGHSVLGESRFEQWLPHESIHGNSIGYTHHQVIRLSFWELGIAQNYLNVDSEMVFLRDFRVSDFLADDITPYTFLSEDFELWTDPAYRESHFLRRREQMLSIKKALGWRDPRFPTMHGGGVYNFEALRLLREEFMDPRGLAYSDLLRIGPIPPTWHSFWVQYRKPYAVIPRRPWYLFIHNSEQLQRLILEGKHEADIAEDFLALNLNTGFSRDAGLLDLTLPPRDALARYSDSRTLLTAALGL